MSDNQYRIGVVGTGFISRGFSKCVLRHCADLELTKVLTRRKLDTCSEFPSPEKLTDSIDELISNSDIIVECSGDVVHATDVVNEAVKAGIPVVTMDAEFHVTTGSWFTEKGIVTEAEGDQPGCLAALYESVTQMGFKPLVLGNVKGFQDINPTRESMEYWSKKQGISLEMVTSATDGTKIQFEQALVANGLGAGILKGGMAGETSEDFYASAEVLAKRAAAQGEAISDFTVIAGSPYRVFVVGEHDEDQWPALEYYKFGSGPYFVIPSTNILCHFEIIKTVRRILGGGSVLLNNTATPKIGISAVTKKALKKGHRIDHALGNFDIRGLAVEIKGAPDHAPMGLLNGAVLEKDCEPGETLQFLDLSIPDSLAVAAWRDIRSSVLEDSTSTSTP